MSIFTSDGGIAGKNENTSLATLDECHKKEKRSRLPTPQSWPFVQDFPSVPVGGREIAALLCSLHLDVSLLLSSLPSHNGLFCQYSCICRIQELGGLEKQLGILQGERYYL